ncbi:flagellin [Paracoccus bogoriensis]|uniref:flagellin N-terminal helical domain-containing protein n=1 Tax=Paracoccus bogoriensis TaxID=242065 RepID=UPI001CA4DA07|nr:flagellin [Paracoccus bogoriensis]MBW7057023.1 flagellin [Paracoccus bogoriensis]
MSSILTNNSAMVALQTLKSVNANLGKAQAEISTGKAVANAKDNAAVWAIAKVMETDQSAFKTIQKNLNVGDAVVATARAGAEQIADLLREMKDLAIGAANDAADFGKIQTDIDAKMAQITSIVSASQLNGINLLATDVNGAGGTSFTVLGSLDRVNSTVATTAGEIVVNGVDFEASIAGATITSINSRADAVTAIGEIEALIDIAVQGAADLGSAGKRISDQANFVGKLSDSLKTGMGALVDADMEEASARLQALQTQQQLGIQALSIANQAPSAILALFR